MQRFTCRAACFVVVTLVTAGLAIGQEKPSTVEFADGQLVLEAPESWQRKEPRSRIVEHEFAIPASEGDKDDGRLTLMGAGGGVEANIARWYGQFKQPDGGDTRDKSKTKKIKVAGHDVHLVDISGTYEDRPGPVAPAVDRPGYRMLAAVIATKSLGTYFVKFYGPARTVADNEQAFVKMIEGLKQKN